jgi:hypothetical protein
MGLMTRVTAFWSGMAARPEKLLQVTQMLIILEICVLIF